MTPENIAKSGNEAAHQTALFQWCALNVTRWPELKWFHAVANGGSRGDNKKSAMIRGAQLKAQGVKAGVSDTFLPVKRGQWSGLYIEMKKPSERPKRGGAGGISDEQAAFGLFVQAQGFGFVVCYGWDEAARVIEQYLEER